MRLKSCAPMLLSMALASCGAPEPERQSLAGLCGPSPSAAAIPETEESKAASEAAKTKLQGAGGDNLGDVVGQMSWHLCNARANGWIDDAFYRKESVALRQAIFKKMGLGTTEEAAATEEREGEQLAETSEDVRKQACLKAAGSDPAAVQACQ